MCDRFFSLIRKSVRSIILPVLLFSLCFSTNSRLSAHAQDSQDTIPTVLDLTISGNTGVASARLDYTDGTPKFATTDGSGNYSFSVSYNWSGTVTPSQAGYTFSPPSLVYLNIQVNQNGQDYTANPIYFMVKPERDKLEAYNWQPGSTITITIDDPATIPTTDYESTSIVNANGNSILNLKSIFDIQAGFIVSVTDGVTTKVHTVTDVEIIEVDTIKDIIFGQAAPSSTVKVYACHASPYYCHIRTTIAASDGSWYYDFSVPGNEADKELIDIYMRMEVGAFQSDADNDQTRMQWTAVSPRFDVSITDDRLGAEGWTPGATLSIQVDDPASPANPDWTTSVTLDSIGRVIWGFPLSPINIQPGYLITCSDGIHTKTLTAAVIGITLVNSTIGTIAGTAEPGSLIMVSVSEPPPVHRARIVDPSGSWQVDFSIPGSDPWEATTRSFYPGDDFVVAQIDNNRDGSFSIFMIPPIISGNAGVANARLDYTDGTAKFATADKDGNYLFNVPGNWSGAVTPSLSGYTFAPVNLSYTYLWEDKIGQNYIATPIPIPTNLQASDGVYTDKVQLTWNNSSGATSYKVYRSSSSSGSKTQLIRVTGTTFDDTTATPGVTFYYWVKACIDANCSDYNTPNTGWRMLTAPINLLASDGTYTDKVQINWTASSGATSYKVFRASSSTGIKTLLGSPTGTTFNDTAAIPALTYYYWVKACIGTRCSTYSTANTGWRKLTAPTNLQASDGTYTTKVQLTWTVSNGATSYQVYRANSSSGTKTLLGSPEGATFADTTATPGATYYYWVKACRGTRCSVYSIANTGWRKP